jgi:tetratricopeptide (TPR) repeat protein
VYLPTAALLLFVATGLAAQSNFPALADQANANRDSGRLEEAVSLYRKALAIRPAWAEGWWSLGTILYDQDDYRDAAMALSKAAILNPHSAQALAMLGLCEAKTDRDQDALKHLRKALSMGIAADPNLGRVVLYTEGTLLLNIGEFGKAQDSLDQLARQGADQQELLTALGDSVLGIRPKDIGSTEAILQAGRAELLAARRETRAALEAYTKLAADFPKLHNVQFAYGRFLLANHQDEQAVAAFRREIENSPQHLLARLGIAGTLLATDPTTALSYAQEAAQIAPKLEEAHYLLGALLLATGSVAQAIPELETARRQDPADARVYFHLERAYVLAHRKEDAARAKSEFNRLNSTEAK